jgi:hypothetical protein
MQNALVLEQSYKQCINPSFLPSFLPSRQMVCFSAKSTNAKKNEMLEEWNLGLKVRVWMKEGRQLTAIYQLLISSMVCKYYV